MHYRIGHLIGASVVIRRDCLAIHSKVSIATSATLAGIGNERVVNVEPGRNCRRFRVICAETLAESRNRDVRSRDHEIDSAGVARQSVGPGMLDDLGDSTA